MVWLLLPSRPKMPPRQFKGRRWLSIADAILWPLVVWSVLSGFSTRIDYAGVLSIATPVLLATWGLRRLRTALFDPLSYSFSTWAVGKMLGWLVLAWLLVKANV
ncbi:hypothetical protein [Aquincola sp. J276]|uniref:hypothetical protein n=1 Tax=Aquincola sp. J276 TaxID=2898432 RepID=UPI0021508AE8|nr:hypothetical protein [Aquincola sp. J276]MCR5864111.1 hypothetical protein [Aquincola sp. J276]